MGVLISIIIGCVTIGIMLSAPMGPIGILCVQRTINNGRQSGLYTGVGAAISDIFYCLLAGFGLSMIDFINGYQTELQIIGSIILIVYALYMMIHIPSSSERIDEPIKKKGKKGKKRKMEQKVEELKRNKNKITQDILTGFLFTLSNPLIVLLILPLFAAQGFPAECKYFYHYILGYVFIVVGALIWWWGITYIVDKVRARINMGSMMLINRIMGGLILVIAIYGLINGLETKFNFSLF
ncbi:MAG: LysE family transporter [Muribaculaceae bacterium]|nr:LysE family transporter [Muribaculaceae bacterium]